MYKYLGILAVVLATMLASPSSFAVKPSVNSFRNKVHVMKASYSFATQGGAVSTINLKDRAGNDATLPSGAIISKVIINVTTPMVSTSNDGTIALTAVSAGDLLSAVDADTVTTIHAGIPVGTAAQMIKLAADKILKVAIATHALTAGAFDVYVEYYF